LGDDDSRAMGGHHVGGLVSQQSGGQGQLIVQLQGVVAQVLPITGNPVTIGRAPDNTLVLPLPLVSKYHAELVFDDPIWLITDLDSQFGTFVAGVRLQPNQPYPLLPGLAVQVGPFVITYRRDNLETHEAQEPVSADPEPMVLETQRQEEQPLRAVLDSPLPDGTAKYLRYLPVIFHGGTFMNRFLQIFEALWEPLEWRQKHIAMYFDPRTCPPEMLNVISQWIGLTPDPRWSEWRHRRILLETAELQRWRGTPYTLSRMIELGTDLNAKIEEDIGEPFVFRVLLPRGTSTQQVDIVRELIETYKPAHTGYQLEVDA
jgi:phage tail-like protein